MKKILHTFQEKPSKKMVKLAVFGLGFVVVPIYAMVMSFLNDVELWILLIIGLFPLFGLGVCLHTLKSKVELLHDRLIVHSLFKNSTERKRQETPIFKTRSV